jgi:formate-dependent nitrite reductase membrane component NrfD
MDKKKAKQVYNTPDKGILWGWEVSAYVWTKAISAGAFLVPFVLWAAGFLELTSRWVWMGVGVGVAFLALTGLLLIKDLDRPDRFLYVLLRPHWGSWLVKGGYAISIYGGLLTALGLSRYMEWGGLTSGIMYLTGAAAVVVAIYTAFLFAQAKGRDFWQSPTLSIHMLVHSLMAGAGIYLIAEMIAPSSAGMVGTLSSLLAICLGVNLFTMLVELVTTHPTKDAKTTVDMIVKGRYKMTFWGGVVLLGNLIPLLMLGFGGASALMGGVAGLLVLVGIYLTEHIWVEAPQRIPLS